MSSWAIQSCAYADLRLELSTGRPAYTLLLTPLGPIVAQELFTEWALWLGSSVPGFNAKWLTNDFKGRVKDAAEPTTRHSIGPLDVLFKLYNQAVTLTDHRLNLTIKFSTATHFNWTSGESTAGLRYWQGAYFRQELTELGVHPMTRPRGVDAVFASTTFHDDIHLVNDCSPTGCQCNTSWSEKVARYASDAAAVATNMTTLQRAGVQVVWFSLFARDKSTHGGPDVVRSVADHVVHQQLRIAGFFGAGGRLVDQWPLYAAYFGLVGSKRAMFGPSSLHYSATSFADRFVLPDLGAMRVQFALDALCSTTSAWEPPCGLGRDNAEQVRLVEAFRPECQCGRYALSTGTALLCRKPITDGTTRSPPWSSVSGFVSSTTAGKGVLLNWEKARVETRAMQSEGRKGFMLTQD